MKDIKLGERVFNSISGISGMFYNTGGHISVAVSHHSQVWKLRENQPPENYAGLILTQVGYNCGMRPAIEPGELTVVIGDGLVGQWSAQTLLHRGAQVVVLGRHEDRLRLLPEGVDGVNARDPNYTKILREKASITAVIDTVGDMGAFQALMPFLRRDSHLVSAGFLGERGLLDIQTVRGKELTIHCPSGWTRERVSATRDAIDQGWISTGDLITHRFPAEQAADAWELILNKNQPKLGVILEWGS